MVAHRPWPALNVRYRSEQNDQSSGLHETRRSGRRRGVSFRAAWRRIGGRAQRRGWSRLRGLLLRAVVRHALGLHRAAPTPMPPYPEEGRGHGQRLARFSRISSSSPATSRTPPTTRRTPAQRMAEFQDDRRRLKVKTVRFMPGEHDARSTAARPSRSSSAQTHYTFDHKGVHFVAARQRVRPGRADRRRAARLAAGRSGEAGKDARDRRADAPPAVRPGAQVGLGHPRRRAGHRAADALRECDRVLRPYPPGTSPS